MPGFGSVSEFSISETSSGSSELNADSGSYSYIGAVADLVVLTPADSGSYSYTGQSVVLSTAANIKSSLSADSSTPLPSSDDRNSPLAFRSFMAFHSRGL